MSENSYSQLLSLLKTVRAAPVNKTAEKLAYTAILKALQAFEADVDYNETLKSAQQDNLPDKAKSSFTNQVQIKLDDKKPCSLAQLLEDFPVLNFISIFISVLFTGIKDRKTLPLNLKRLIDQIQIPLFRLAITQPKIILDPQHTGFLLINELLDYEKFWKDESKIGYPTYSKLSQILLFSNSSKQQLSDHFSSAIRQVVQIKNNQQKRALIFEKRLKETELGKAKILAANQVTCQIVSQVNQLDDLPDILLRIFNRPWLKLLQLEYLREDDNAFSDALQLMKSLIISLKPIRNRRSLDQLFEDLPIIKQQLKAGFDKTALDDDESGALLADIEAMHIALISDSEKTIKEAEDSDRLIQSGESNSESEEILRLKPTGIFADLSTESNKTQGQKSEELAPLINQQPIDTLFANLNQDIQTLTLRFNNNPTDKELDPKVATLIENGKHYPWFYFIMDESKSLHKLVLSIESVGQHIFVDINGNKSHKLDTHTFSERLIDESICPLQQTDIYKESSKLYLAQLSEYVKVISKKQRQNAAKEKKELDKLNAEIALQAENKIEEKNEDKTEVLINKSASDKINPPIESAQEIRSSSKEQSNPVISNVDITFITVGTWIKINIDKETKRCKLAARIISKGLYIFVDRQGIKICEITTQVLEEKVSNGEIEIINAQLSDGKSLETIISTTRNMKT